jgi:RNA polymerase sigma-70 factor (ECF subfamily)
VASSDSPLQVAPEREMATRAPAATAKGDDARQDDYNLVQRLIASDAAAWQAFVERFGRLVLSRVLATVREMNQSLTGQDAEDLCADVFSQLVAGGYAALARFEGRSTLSTWLCVVTRRIVVRRLASRRRELWQAAAQPPALESLPGSAEENPLTLMIGDEDRALLKAALAELSERQREMARLFYIDGCSYREISQTLDMPMNSVGPTLNRIHAKLRAALTHEE